MCPGSSSGPGGMAMETWAGLPAGHALCVRRGAWLSRRGQCFWPLMGRGQGAPPTPLPPKTHAAGAASPQRGQRRGKGPWLGRGGHPQPKHRSRACEGARRQAWGTDGAGAEGGGPAASLPAPRAQGSCAGTSRFRGARGALLRTLVSSGRWGLGPGQLTHPASPCPPAVLPDATDRPNAGWPGRAWAVSPDIWTVIGHQNRPGRVRPRRSSTSPPGPDPRPEPLRA